MDIPEYFENVRGTGVLATADSEGYVDAEKNMQSLRVKKILGFWYSLKLKAVCPSLEAEKMRREIQKATFAGGCFWCTESDFEKVDGVTEVLSGYTGGSTANPTYEEVSSGRTGHVEAVQVLYDPEKIYERPDDKQLRNSLTPMQYKVTQKEGTEPPFNNEYWDSKKEGIYVDIVSGEPLFSSLEKFDSGTGWPSFTKPLKPDNIVERKDRSLFLVRTEVRSRHGDSHLGHVFPDGPKPTGLRYCLNSASLRFIPKQDLEKEGYGEYLHLFEEHR